MNRRGRGHKSSKVPNVRLRPADPAARPRRVSPDASLYIEDTQIIGSDDTISYGASCPRPFKNFIICATGIQDKTSIFKAAIELGATHVSAFTDRVTHLIADKHGGPKYQCALERRVPILKPSWILDSHAIWQHGDDVDAEESMAKHRLPIFSDIVVCMSGIPQDRRAQIAKKVLEHGGKWYPVIERPVRVTHLLCGGKDETDKMKYAERFNRRKEADIKLVWEEWLWDCIEYKGRLEEERYSIQQPRKERLPIPPPPTKATNATPSTDVPSVFDVEPEADEIIHAQRLPAVTLELWESLLKKRGYEINPSHGNVMLSPKKAKELEAEHRRTQRGDVETEEDRTRSVISSFRRCNTVLIPNPGAVAGPSRLPFARSTTVPNNDEAIAGSDAAIGRPLAQDTIAALKVTSSTPQIFSGVKFSLRGEIDTPAVRNAILGAGGEIVDGDNVDYILVRLAGGSSIYVKDKAAHLRPKYRTECWLEQCLAMEQIVSAYQHVTFIPINARLPIPGINKIVFSFSGLEAAEACWMRRLLKALEIQLATAFSRHSTHLLCPSGSGPKFEHAQRWNIPVITIGWLEEMARDSTIPSVTPYLVKAADAPAPLEEIIPRNNKGKQKADDRMQDITNNSQEEDATTNKGFFLPSLPPQRPSADSNPDLRFGRPSLILGGDVEPPASPSPPKRRSTAATPLRPLRPAVPTPIQSSPGAGPALRRSGTVAAVETGASLGPRRAAASKTPARGVVPSSASPSPIKRGVSITPPKIPEARTRALQESIVSLLGKHSRPETPEDGGETVQGRPGKRNRAQRKAQSRHPSDAVPQAPPPAPVKFPLFGGPRSQSPGTGDDLYEGMSVSLGAEEQSMRVVYEDPEQRQEKQRLAELVGMSLESETGHGAVTREGTSKKRPRRSTRKPGF
ncbi:hypothetical protein MKEN_00035100 [Mycena kentingensis (nom. inval.)]|nr:hypothetical protein MKEN_00035100 [Mycena kentingensis (nom. inval.)]